MNLIATYVVLIGLGVVLSLGIHAVLGWWDK